MSQFEGPKLTIKRSVPLLQKLHDAHVHKVLLQNIERMGAEFVGYGSIARRNRELAEWHRNSDYSIVHPPNSKIPRNVPGHVPAGLRVLKTQKYEVQGEISVTCAAKVLSFASEADFLSYVDIVVPDINQKVHSVRLRSELSPYTNEPMRLLEFFRENTAVREWLATLATLLTEPKLILTNIPVPPGCIVEREEYLRRPLFILPHAVQIIVFAPVDWREDGSYHSTDTYGRRFPLGFPRPSPNDEKAFGEYILDALYRALILQHFLFRQRSDGMNEKRYRDPLSISPPEAEAPKVSAVARSFIIRLPREIQHRIVELASSPKVTPTLLNRPKELRRYSKVQSTWKDSILALKLSSRLMYRFAIAEQNVEGVVDQRAVFRMNLDIDTPRVFDMGLPDFRTATGISVLPLPKLEEFSVIFTNVAGYWMIEGLQRARTQTDVPDSAHTGIKWQFNTGLYPVPSWKGRSHDSHFNGSEKPYMHPDSPILKEAIPYVGHWGYEHRPGAIGGYWASFQYFEKTKDMYFGPLSWKEVQPLVKGPFGKNGREVL
ncbi:uncharacterized protein FPRN_03572 [Fusarium proliferatum]|nr:uncharacterized protein FPRN_03572 [Fusarium proliferatum]